MVRNEWTAQEDEAVLRFFSPDMVSAVQNSKFKTLDALRRIGREIDRTPLSVASRLVRLGVVEDDRRGVTVDDYRIIVGHWRKSPRFNKYTTRTFNPWSTFEVSLLEACALSTRFVYKMFAQCFLRTEETIAYVFLGRLLDRLALEIARDFEIFDGEDVQGAYDEYFDQDWIGCSSPYEIATSLPLGHILEQQIRGLSIVNGNHPGLMSSSDWNSKVIFEEEMAGQSEASYEHSLNDVPFDYDKYEEEYDASEYLFGMSADEIPSEIDLREKGWIERARIYRPHYRIFFTPHFFFNVKGLVIAEQIGRRLKVVDVPSFEAPRHLGLYEREFNSAFEIIELINREGRSWITES